MDSINSQLVFEISVPPLVVHSNPISETLDRGLGLLQKNKVLDQVTYGLSVINSILFFISPRIYF